MEDLQRQVLKSEAALRIKEEETLTLKQQIHQYETRWSDYEMKMRSMEEMWQKQMTSLQVGLFVSYLLSFELVINYHGLLIRLSYVYILREPDQKSHISLFSLFLSRYIRLLTTNCLFFCCLYGFLENSCHAHH